MPMKGKTCFVIMPFGEKTEADGTVIHFDDVYDRLIKCSIDALKMTCVRADKIDEAGFIHRKMFEHVYTADVAIVDITTLNPNVFYELGMRHALVPCVTVLIRRKGTQLPFNIRMLNVIEYGDIADATQLQQAKDRITTFITNGLERYGNDSIIHEVLDVRVPSPPAAISRKEVVSYPVSGTEGRSIALVTGDLRFVQNVDVWVNSENTNMQMARLYDPSVSSLIRYLGAQKNRSNQIVRDVIAEDLAKAMKGKSSVDAGEVLVTTAGALAATHNVKRVFHAAAVVGQFVKGYSPIRDVGMCVTNALTCMDSPALRKARLRSILFPLIGTGQGGGKREEKATQLINAAITYLRAHEDSCVEIVYFLVWSQVELETCQRVLRKADLKPSPTSSKSKVAKRPARAKTTSPSRSS